MAGITHRRCDHGKAVVASPGEFPFIEPGHRACVVGDETCVLIDW